jgi:hypothetical protein
MRNGATGFYDHPRSIHLHAEQRAAAKASNATHDVPPVQPPTRRTAGTVVRRDVTTNALAQLRARHVEAKRSLAARHAKETQALEADHERRRMANPRISAGHAPSPEWIHSEWISNRVLAERQTDDRRRLFDSQAHDFADLSKRARA